MTGADVLRVAARQIGVCEQPAGSNNVPYNTWYYGHPVHGPEYPWCMTFVQWVYTQAGGALPFLTASCGSLLRWYSDHQPDCIKPEPVPGCIVIFDLPNTSSTTDHTGLFVALEDGMIKTIDGNTGSGNDANGGCVQQRQRKVSEVKPVYIVPRELKEEKRMDRYDNMAEIRAAAPWAVDTVTKLIECGALTGTTGWYDEDGMPTGLDLSQDMLRVLVIMDRYIDSLQNKG